MVESMVKNRVIIKLSKYHKIFDKIFRVEYIHIADILVLYNGKMTSEQYIVASRLLDIERAEYNGGYPWQIKLAEAAKGKTLSYKEKRDADRNFSKLIASMDENGWNPKISQISISCAGGVFALQNGTHRVAYILASKRYNEYLPVKMTWEYPWFPLDGKKYMESLLPKEELVLLEERYHTILKSINTRLEGFIDLKFLSDKIKRIISEYGEINVYEIVNVEKIDCNQLKGNCVKLLKELLKKGRTIALFSVELKSQQLYHKQFKIHSAATEAIETIIMKEIKAKKWGKIFGTITESSKFRILINEAKI